MIHTTGIKLPFNSKFWVTKSPICCKTDALELLLYLSTAHPPSTCKWVCGKTSSTEVNSVQFKSEVPRSPSGDSGGCDCTQRISERLLLSTGLAFRSDLKEQGGDGLLGTLYIQSVLNKIPHNRVNLCKNACDFLSFILSKPAAVTSGPIPTNPCHWCSEYKAVGELFDKGKFSYCSMICLEEHRAVNFSPKKKKVT
eukprot:Lankesteria_metandrocarpae@DN2966_c0_g1_i1.p1